MSDLHQLHEKRSVLETKITAEKSRSSSSFSGSSSGTILSKHQENLELIQGQIFDAEMVAVNVPIQFTSNPSSLRFQSVASPELIPQLHQSRIFLTSRWSEETARTTPSVLASKYKDALTLVEAQLFDCEMVAVNIPLRFSSSDNAVSSPNNQPPISQLRVAQLAEVRAFLEQRLTWENQRATSYGDQFTQIGEKYQRALAFLEKKLFEAEMVAMDEGTENPAPPANDVENEKQERRKRSRSPRDQLEASQRSTTKTENATAEPALLPPPTNPHISSTNPIPPPMIGDELRQYQTDHQVTISNLPDSVRDNDTLWAFMRSRDDGGGGCGIVQECDFVGQGVGLVTFAEVSSATRAIKLLHCAQSVKEPHFTSRTRVRVNCKSNAIHGMLHPCIRVHGQCRDDARCRFSSFPYAACMTQLQNRVCLQTKCGDLHLTAEELLKSFMKSEGRQQQEPKFQYEDAVHFAPLPPSVRTEQDLIDLFELVEFGIGTQHIRFHPKLQSAHVTFTDHISTRKAIEKFHFKEFPGGEGNNTNVAVRLRVSADHPAHEGMLHPCIRVYGCCDFSGCTFEGFPYAACIKQAKVGVCEGGKILCDGLHLSEEHLQSLKRQKKGSKSQNVNEVQLSGLPSGTSAEDLHSMLKQAGVGLIEGLSLGEERQGFGALSAGGLVRFLVTPAEADHSDSVRKIIAHFHYKKLGGSTIKVKAHPNSSALEGMLHPCLRVFGRCLGIPGCKFKMFPYAACLQQLKGEVCEHRRFANSQRCNGLHLSDAQITHYSQVNPHVSHSLDSIQLTELPPSVTTDQQLIDLFDPKEFGPIVSVRLLAAHAANSRCRGYVTFADIASVKKAISKFHYQTIQGSVVKVKVNGKSKALEGMLHPCLKAYGHCPHGNFCRFSRFPYAACVVHLKGRPCLHKDNGGHCTELHLRPEEVAAPRVSRDGW